MIKLDGYLPVRVPQGIALCPAISFERLLLDLPSAVELRGRIDAQILCHDRLAVAVTLDVEGVAPGPGSGRRWTCALADLDDAGRDSLSGFIGQLRKAAHLSIAREQDVEARLVRAGWDDVRLRHVALPELGWEELDTSVELFGKKLGAPLLIAGMTGGSERAGTVNSRLARAAEGLRLPMGLGSQRVMLERPVLAGTFAVRDLAPSTLLIGNVGAVQLNRSVTADDCVRLVEEGGLDAFALHLNVLQELVQPEGDRDWRGLLGKIGAVARRLPVPLVVKETGCGISGAVALRLRDEGVACIDVGGAGGTSWGWIEGFRAADPERAAIGETFRDWGLPTRDALLDCRRALGPDFPLIATGGVRSGLDVARAIALGADLAGVALPFFRAADAGEDDALRLAERFVAELRIAMMCAGARTVSALRGAVA
jgi:isopentenyl-diphosphate delta-isomerase